MKRITKRTVMCSLALGMLSGLAAWSGTLFLEVGNPEANSESRGMRAALIARATACHEPAKSIVTASYVQAVEGKFKRTELAVAALKTPGTFAILGTLPEGSIIDVAVTNPEYKDFQPRVLIRSDSHGVHWGSVRRFFNSPPSDSDFRGMLAEVD